MHIPRIAQLRTADDFRRHIDALGIELPFDDLLETGPDAPLAQPITLPDGFTIGNRFCAQPMEGWDGTSDGLPTDLTLRRWQHFGRSGAKLIWGGEAVAVRHDGRANPNQLIINSATLPALRRLREALVRTHEQHHASSVDLLVGLQLTHSGRFARPDPDRQLKPVIAYHHPYLDAKFGIGPDYPVISDDALDTLIAQFVKSAVLAQKAGFDFVDLKHCHGYLGHELLSAVERPGRYGGSFESRTQFLREIVSGIRAKAPDLRVGVRVSIFDLLPFEKDSAGIGYPVNTTHHAFGADASGLAISLEAPRRFLALLEELGIALVNLTAGTPYYNPHIQRPALFPPSDGYLPPEDPLVGVARQIDATARLKAEFPNLVITGTAYSYLQEWLPHIAQFNVRHGRVDLIGVGRLLLSYPEFPADVLAGRPLDRKRLCRTFSDCTTAPRLGLVSGCYPLDPVYKSREEASILSEAKKSLRTQIH